MTPTCANGPHVEGYSRKFFQGPTRAFPIKEAASAEHQLEVSGGMGFPQDTVGARPPRRSGGRCGVLGQAAGHFLEESDEFTAQSVEAAGARLTKEQLKLSPRRK